MDRQSDALREPTRSPQPQPAPARTPDRATSTPVRGGGITRAEAPGRIPLSPLKFSSSLHPSPSQMPASHTPGGSAASPLLTWANELPDDPQRASNVMGLYPSSLAPPFSPAAPLPQHSNSDPSPYFPPPSDTRAPLSGSMLGLSPVSERLAAPQTPSRLIPPSLAHAQQRMSPEPSIFERDIEPVHHARSPQEAIDVAVPPVLDDAASAIVEESGTLEIIQPEHPAYAPSPPRSPSAGFRMMPTSSQPGQWTPNRDGRGRPRNLSGGQSSRENSFDTRPRQQQYGRQHGHRRPLSDASNVFTSMPGRSLRSDSHSERERRSPLHAGSPLTPSTRPYSIQPATSPSLSIDGAIIAGNDAATMGHSFGGLADAFAHLATTPSEQPAIATPGSMTSPQGSYFALQPDDAPRAPRDRSSAYASPNAFRYMVLDREGERSPPTVSSTPPSRLAVSPLPGSHPRASPNAGARSSTTPVPAPAITPRSPLPRHTAPPAGADGDPFSPHLQVPGTSSERKRLSFMAYADIVNDSQGQLLDLDESIQLQVQQEQGTARPA